MSLFQSATVSKVFKERSFGNDILDHLGSISHEQALQKANDEYEKFKEQAKNDPSQVEIHFVKQLESSAKELKGKKGKK